MAGRTACALIGVLAGAAQLLCAQPTAARSAAGGSIRGHVGVGGPIPGNGLIRMGMDPKCAAMNAGARVFDRAVVAMADGSLADVFVKLDGVFPQTPVPAEPVVVDQRQCVYGPRVVGVRVGQTLRIRNDDDLLHNVHSSSGNGNTFNVGQPKAGMVFSLTPKAEEIMVKLGCDVHRWMTAYVGVVSHPYFAVSSDDGTFVITGVPTGTYTIRAWHERFGELSKGVTVKAGAPSIVDIGYSQSGGQ